MPAHPIVLASVLAAAAAPSSESHLPATGDAFATSVAPFLAQHCYFCHGATRQRGGIEFDDYADERTALADRDVWPRVREQLALGEMPPAKRPRPPKADVDAVIAWIDANFARESAASDTDSAPPGTARAVDPGRVTLRRLNRTQYENTIRDLVGVDYDASRELPADDVGYGFDDIGDVLSMADILMEKYLAAAERIAARAVVIEDPAHPPSGHYGAADLEGTKGSVRRGDEQMMFTTSEVAVQQRFPRDGEYVLRARAYGEQAGPDPARMALRIDGREVARIDVKAVAAAPETYSVRARVSGGTASVAAAFINDYFKADDPDPKNRDRNLVVLFLEVEGPIDPLEPSAFQKRYLGADADERGVLADVALHAYRRPATEADIDRLIALSPPDATLAECVRTALKAMLVSPRFLFRVESDKPGAPRGDRASAELPAVHAIDDWELASRLSYFLWSSMPDDELFARAARGELHEGRVLDAEVARMLRDARSSSLSRDFAGQWLETRNLDRVAPDAKRFPEFDDELRAAMRSETEMFFDAILRENRSVWELVDSDFTFVDERLAKLYGIPGVHGPEMRRVRLQGGPRGGVLTQASVLTVTSNPTRTSPVKRGKWILENLIGKPTPPPPPGVGVLDENHKAASPASLRERLARHREDPACAACHARLDPLGFALENFDAIGAWRERDGDFAIDATGALPSATGELPAASGEQDTARAFRGPNELKQVLSADDAFVRCLAKKLATYALGRGVGPGDEPALDALERSLAGKPPTLADVIVGIVHMDAFRMRRAEKGGS
jgi:mono/diheme cytochrome c family protein